MESPRMAPTLPHTFTSIKRSYRQKPPPGKDRKAEEVEEAGEAGEATHVLSQPGQFLFLSKFLTTDFIHRIHDMEVAAMFLHPRCGRTTCGW